MFVGAAHSLESTFNCMILLDLLSSLVRSEFLPILEMWKPRPWEGDLVAQLLSD